MPAEYALDAKIIVTGSIEYFSVLMYVKVHWTGYFTISRLLEVNVGISQRSAGDDVPAHTDRHDGSRRREFLVEHGLCNIRMQVPYIQRGEGIC